MTEVRSNLCEAICVLIQSQDWLSSTPEQRKTHVEFLLESLEHKDPEIRFTNARRLFYILQGALRVFPNVQLAYDLSGTFRETTSPEHQLHWIFENCKVVRGANGVSTIVEAMKIAQSKHDFLWCVSILPLYFMMLTARSGLQDQDLEHFNISVQDKNDLVEEVTTEISVYLGMIYHIVEVFKGHEDFADELSA